MHVVEAKSNIERPYLPTENHKIDIIDKGLTKTTSIFIHVDYIARNMEYKSCNTSKKKQQVLKDKLPWFPISHHITAKRFIA